MVKINREQTETAFGFANDAHLINIKIINSISFTNREIDIIACIIGGRSYKTISSFLSISPNTVECHVRNIMLKLGCNSRENIIDFIERSNKFTAVKKYYAQLLIKSTFKLKLKKISKLTKNNNINCLVFYYKKQKTNQPIAVDLEKHLNLAGINTISKIWDISKVENFFLEQLKLQEVNYIIYVITNNFLAQLKNNKHEITKEAAGLITILKQRTQNVIFLLCNDETVLTAHEKLADFTCINLKEHNNYYLLVFELIQKLLPNSSIDKNITDFTIQQATLLNSPLLQQGAEEDETTRQSLINYFSSVKKIFIAAIINLLLIIAIGFMVFHPEQHTQIASKYDKIEHKINVNKSRRQDSYTKEKNKGGTSGKVISPQFAPAIRKHINSVSYKRTIQQTMLLNLPPHNVNFTGRERALQQIEEQLNKQKFGIITQAISGLGGIGKTQLATEFVYQAVEHNDYNIVFWVIAEDTASVSNSYREFAKQLHIDIRGLTLNEIQALVHNTVIKEYNIKKVLFVLDNVSTHDKIQNHLIELRKQWPANYLLHVLITTRSQSWNIPPLILDTFTPIEAGNYVKKHLPNEQNDIIKQLTKKLHYFPLALSQAVAYVKEHTNIEDYLKLYESNKPIFLNKLPEDQNQKSLWNTLIIILPKLSNNAKEILYTSAYINPDDIPIEFFSNFSTEERADAIKDLRKHSLITLTNSNKSFFIHRMLQDIIKLNIQTEMKEMEAIWINKAINLLADKFDFNYSTPDKWHLWQQYLSHAHSVSKYAINMQGKTFQQGIKLYCKTVMVVTYLQREMRVAAKMWDTIKQIVAQQYTGSSAQLIMADINLSCGWIWRILGQHDKAKACMESAIAAYQQLDAKTITKGQELTSILKLMPLDTVELIDSIKYDLSFALIRLGNFYRELGQYEQAMINYNQSFSIVEQYKNTPTAQYNYASLLWNIGCTDTYTGKLIEAERLLITAKDIMGEKYVNHPSIAYAYEHLAMLMYNIGKFKQGKELAERALAIRTVVFTNHHYLIAYVKLLIGMMNYAYGDVQQAKIDLAQVEEIYNMNFNEQHVRYIMLYLSLHHIYEATKEYDKSLTYLNKALVIAKKNYGASMHDAISFKITRAETWPKLDQVGPIDYWQNALHITALLFGDNHYQTARYHYLLGQVLQKHGKVSKAKGNYEKALAIMQKEKITHPNLAKYYKKNTTAIQTKLGELQARYSIINSSDNIY